jgi:hypothetical protein
MDSCPCGILQKKGSENMEQKKDRWSVVPPLMRSNFFPPIADPMGSYTGIPEDPFETPVQDADDL